MNKILLIGNHKHLDSYITGFKELADIYILCGDKEKGSKLDKYLININYEKIYEKIYEIDVIIILSEKLFTDVLKDKILKITKRLFIFSSYLLNYDEINNSNVIYSKTINTSSIKQILNKHGVIKFDKTNINNLLNNSSKKSKKIINTNNTNNISQISIKEINIEYRNFCCYNL